MSLISYKRGQGSIVLRVKLRDSSVSTGAGLTGLTESSASLIIGTIADNEATSTAYTQSGSTIETITTLGTYAAPTSTKCRFKEVDSTNHKGIYEIQLADARYNVSSAKSLIISVSGATDLAECDVAVPLTDLDPYDSVRAGLTTLPNAAADAAGGLPISDAGGLALDTILDVAVSTRLAPTTASRTLDVTAGGCAGIDWANIEAPTTAVDLSGTDIQLCDTITTYTGNTLQTGDSFARLGTPAGASVSADVAAVKVDTAATLVDTAEIGAAGAGLTAVPWNAAWDAEVQSECNDALVALGLDHLINVAVTGTDVTDNSIVAKLVSKSATADWDDFVNTTDSLQNIRDELVTVDTNVDSILVDTAEIGAAGAGLTAIAWNSSWDTEVQSECNDALVALGLDHLINVAVTGTDITDDSIIAQLVSKSATADWDDFDNTTDSHEAIADDISADLAAIKAETVLIVADTNELQTDWVNGGRLDVIVDSILADTADIQPKIGTPTADLSADIAVVKAETATIVADTNELQTDDVPGLIAALNDLSSAEVNTQVDSALDTAIPGSPASGSINETIKRLARSVGVVQEFTVDTGVFSSTTSECQVDAVDIDSLEGTDDHYIGRVMLFTSGVLKHQATDISDYDGTNKRFSFTALTEAPGNNDTFIVV